jgi:O-antigen/teichoic acid export membrane protein
MGLDQSLVRFYYEHDDIEYKSELLYKCVIPTIIVCVIVSILFVGLVLLNVINFEFNTFITVNLCIFTLLQIIYRFSLLLVRLSYKSKTYSALNILNRIVYIGTALPLVLLVKGNYLFILTISITIAIALCVLVSIYVQRDIWKKTNKKRYDIDNAVIYKYGFPFIISMGITTIFQAMDKISLNYFCTYTEVGIYSSTMTLVNIFAIIQTTFNTLWAPMATEHFTNNCKDRTFYQTANQVITVVMFSCGLLLILCKDVFALLLGSEYREAAYILPCLIFHPIMYTISETTVMGISFMKKSKMHIIVALVSCITNIIGNTILVPIYGCKGAAISTGLSYIVFFTLRTIISNKYFYVDFKLRKFYLLTCCTVIYALYNTFIRFNVGSVIGFVICMIVLLTLYKDTIMWSFDYLLNFVKVKLRR